MVIATVAVSVSAILLLELFFTWHGGFAVLRNFTHFYAYIVWEL